MGMRAELETIGCFLHNQRLRLPRHIPVPISSLLSVLTLVMALYQKHRFPDPVLIYKTFSRNLMILNE